MELLEELNGVQREAVLHDAGPALVLAGAGSGKTRVLTRRLAHLIRERGVSPFSVLAITFTNKAAREMKERCEELIGERVQHMWIGTFHAICLRILRSNVHRVGYRPGFVIYDQREQRTVVREAMKELNISEKRLDPAAVLHAISRAKNRLRGPSDLESGQYPFMREVTEIYRRYQKLLRGYNAMDFDDLLARTVTLLRDDSGMLAHYQKQFQHVLVDEYQDTNHVQYRLVKLLSAGYRSVFAVGDSDQSIYGWRGADINNILNFEADFPEARIYRMEENYRSTEPILRAAQRMIRCNERRQEKDLWTRRSGGDPVCFYRAPSGEEEARFVVSYIEQLVREGHHRWADFAVLYRTHAQSRLLEETCIRRGVAYRIFGGQHFYERSEVTDAIAMMRLLVNGDDWISLRRVINRPRRGVGPATMQRLEDFAAGGGYDIYETLDRVDQIDGIRGAQRRGVDSFAGVLGRVRAEIETSEPAELLRMFLLESGYLDQLEGVEGESRRENLDELIGSADVFIRDLRGGRIPGAGALADQGEEAVAAFLSTVALLTDADEHAEEAGEITLLTLHSAKGLEFPAVFIVGMEEGLFPHVRSMDSPEQLEEERRLCYVGMTRAQDRLILTCADVRSMYGETSRTIPSRFLGEIGEEKLAAVGSPGGGRGGPGASRDASPRGQRQNRQDRARENFAPGVKVRHRVWGEGTVVQHKRAEGDLELTIVFVEEGLKTVVADQAPLERVRR